MIGFCFVLILNFLCIFFYKEGISEDRGIGILLFSQFTFLAFLAFSYFSIRKAFSNFFKELLLKMDCMISRKLMDAQEVLDDTFPSQVYHRLYRLYDILLSQQRSLESERNKLQSFITDISHQVKTPITSLKLLQAALEQSELSTKEYEKNLEALGIQIEKLDFLIQSLLKTSQLENGIIRLQPEMASVNATILSALEGVIFSAERKEIEVTFDNSEDYVFWHDARWTGEALFNIMDNAVKYTPMGGRITILLGRTEDYVKISVADTGIGIPKAELPHIFRRFWRGNTGISEGNGIGLYLCRQIVDLQQGYVLADSAVDVGTRFDIYLPYKV